ncbi:unnamed protein product [Linum tenue]|uniref:MsrB domain-containing protein n=1 Tax=Linum tenue TaxID=586396 RepID=A0AAV0P5N2_9ROSI|nr:unnamed protein product [Linum tenue]
MAAAGSVQKTDEEWRAILSPEQFRILREKGTELKFTGEYDKFFDEGVYKCAGCGTPLYKSATKFNSGCGWPAFCVSVSIDGKMVALLLFSRTQMGGELRSHVQLAAGIWAMFSRVKGSRPQQMNATVSTASLSSLFLGIDGRFGVCLWCENVCV